MNSRTGAPSWPLVIEQPGRADGEVAADRVDAAVQALHRLDQHAVVDVGDEGGLVAGAGLELQGEAADAGRALEAAAHGVAGAARADAAGAVAVVHEALQHAVVDQHVAPRGEALAVDVGGRVRQRVGRVVDERERAGGPPARRRGPRTGCGP